MANFELTPVLNANTGKYEIINFDALLESVKKYISERHIEELTNEAEYKDLKAIRTEIRARKELIKDVRIQANELFFGTFNEQAKTIESLLNEEDEHLRKLKEAWEEENNNKLAKPKLIRITVKTYDPEVAKRIKDTAIMCNAEVEVK